MRAAVQHDARLAVRRHFQHALFTHRTGPLGAAGRGVAFVTRQRRRQWSQQHAGAISHKLKFTGVQPHALALRAEVDLDLLELEHKHLSLTRRAPHDPSPPTIR